MFLDMDTNGIFIGCLLLLDLVNEAVKLYHYTKHKENDTDHLKITCAGLVSTYEALVFLTHCSGFQKSLLKYRKL